MASLEYPTYLDHIRSESARFRAVLTDCDPGARVPACPDWDAADLLWHLAEVQLFWAKVVRHRPAAPDQIDEPPAQRPTSYADLLDTFDDFSHALIAELERAQPDQVAWHWSPVQTVATSYRRQAQEALVHRLDAEQTAGVQPAPVDASLAADGVAEALEVMYGGEPPAWAPFRSVGGLVAVEIADTGDRILVDPGSIEGADPDSERTLSGPHLLVVADTGLPTVATVRGTAAELDAWLWHRRDESDLACTGEPTALAAFRSAVAPSLD